MKMRKSWGLMAPYIAMMFTQFGIAGMHLITKLSMDKGMNNYVFVVYRQAFAAAAVAPFALTFERGKWPKITFTIFAQIFTMGLLGPVIDLNMYYVGLKFTSPTIASAVINALPVLTFIVAVLFRMEKVNLKKVHVQAKLLGTLVTIAGVLVMILYKGQVFQLHLSKADHHYNNNNNNNNQDCAKGLILLLAAQLAFAAFCVLQAIVLKKYTAQLSLTVLVCFAGIVQSAVLALIMEHDMKAWAIGLDVNLLAAAYGGIITSGIAYYVQGRVADIRGPVFVTAFSPVATIVLPLMDAFIISEKFYLGGIIGAVMVMVGILGLLWGKHKEYRQQVQDDKAGETSGIPEYQLHPQNVNSVVI